MNQYFSTVAIIGKSNVGKSTLINYIIGQKISIVTHKIQTTRNTIKGIFTCDNYQIVFFDSPGIFSPKNIMGKQMLKQAWNTTFGVDFIMLTVNLKNNFLSEEDIAFLNKLLKRKESHLLLIVNKIDLIKNFNKDFEKFFYDKLNKTFTSFLQKYQVFFISSIQGSGIADVLSYIKKFSALGKWMFDKDDITTSSMRFIASELTREVLFLSLGKELPYNLVVETEEWKKIDENNILIRQVITVVKESHKIIIIGKSGKNIANIGKKSRIKINEELKINCHLKLFVKVRQNILDKPIKSF